MRNTAFLDGLDSLFEVLLSVARERFPRAEAREGKEAGIWTESGAGGAKLAALGIRIVGGVVQHGVSVNGFPTPESFAGIRPCGLDAPVAYFGGSFEDLRVQLQTAFLQRFPGFRSG